MDAGLRDTAIRAEIAAFGAERAELWSDIADITHVETETSCLVDRLRQAQRVNAVLAVHTSTRVVIRGHCDQVGSDVVVLRDGASRTAIALAHITRIDGVAPALHDRDVPVLTVRQLLRQIAVPCRIDLIDGASLAGVMRAVAADYLAIGDAEHLVRLAAIVTIRWTTSTDGPPRNSP